MIGEEFGKLTVIGRAPDRPESHKSTYWLCQCECGNTTEVARSNLKKKGRGVKSCGCLLTQYRREKSPYWLGVGELSTTIVAKMKRHAKRRKIPFDLKIEYLWDLFIKQKKLCALSGLLLTFPKNHTSFCAGDFTASLDRINSESGYVVGNVQWVHKDINMMKQRFGNDHFIQMCQHVANWRKKCPTSS